MKQEKLEEVTEKKFINIGGVLVLEDDTKSQQSYSEEEVLNIIQLFNDDFNMIQDTVPKWFEQFKKK